MAAGKITKRTVDALAPGPKDQFLWDDELRGFGLKVTPAGAKVYLVQYRQGGRGTPTQRYTIGKHGSPWAPQSAREEAARILQRVAQGGNPMEEKRERERLAVDLAFPAYAERFIAGYLVKKWPRSHGLAARLLRTHVIPSLKSKSLPAIRAGDIEALLEKLPADQLGLRYNVFAAARLLFRRAYDTGDLDKSPLQGIDVPKPPDERARKLADWELRHVWRAALGLGYPFGPFYRLLALSGQRREEVAGIDWRELHRAHREWLLPAGRAKNGHETLIHLSDAMISDLDAIAGGERWPRRGFVFTTNGGKSSISGYSKGKARLDKAVAALLLKAGDPPMEPWRVHDLRRTQATGLQRLGFRSEVIESVQNRITGRSKPGSAKVYQRYDWEPERIAAFRSWSAHVEQIASDAGPTVVSLAARRA